MSTTSDTSVNAIGGVQTFEQGTQKSLYGSAGEASLGKDVFLRLLTTQLQHQDPLNPMDNTEFVAQLSQFSSLEQLTGANERLDNLAIGMTSVGSATMVNLIGKEVRAVGDGFHYAGDPATKDLHYNLDGAATDVTVTIYDAAGTPIRMETVKNLGAGDQKFTWDGKTKDGLPAAAGDYTFKISAVNGDGSVGATTYTQGVVDQIDFSTGAAAPRIDGQTLTVDKIVQILDGE